MHIDSFTTAALADELRQTIQGGRVQNIIQITPISYCLEIYHHSRRHYLLVSADPQAPRLHLQSFKPRRGVGSESQLYQLLRKYLGHAHLMGIEQPELERVVLLRFADRLYQTTLIIELLGTRSNLIFVDDQDQILSVARPIPAHPNRSRVLLPKVPYTLPPAQNKLTAKTLTVEVLIDVADRAPERNLLSKTLVTRLLGMSPLIAREIVYRAYGDAGLRVGQVHDFTPLLQAIRRIYAYLEQQDWQPHVAFDKNERVEYFAPIPLTHLPQVQAVESISKAVEAHFNRVISGQEDDGYAAARFPIHLALEQAQARLARRLEKLADDAAALEDPEVYRKQGEALLAYSHQVERGQTDFEVTWLDGEILEIRLDPALSVADNAQRYFARYQKAKRAAEIIPAQQAQASLELEYLEQLVLDLEQAESRPEIDAVAQALEEAGHGRSFKKDVRRAIQKKAVPAASRPRRFISPDGFTVWVGRNAQQNHELTFHQARPDDIWLHARGVPGSHVVIAAPDERPPKTTIAWAAGIAAYYSKAKKAGRAIVSYTRRKYVRPIKGAPPGLVRIRNESTVRVAPFRPKED